MGNQGWKELSLVYIYLFIDKKRIKCTIDGQPRLERTQLTNWFPDYKKLIAGS